MREGLKSHAELAPIAIGTASLPNGKDSDFRQNDVYCHAEFTPIATGTASLPNGKDSDFRQNDIFSHAEFTPIAIGAASLPNGVLKGRNNTAVGVNPRKRRSPLHEPGTGGT
ncbi:MAG: hypothetical protein J5651_01785 [Salinivirgaceae bacterium]|nr:hypothetical protein [Salinivirgaceae bacterium]